MSRPSSAKLRVPRERERQAQAQSGKAKPLSAISPRDFGDFVAAKPTVMHTNGQDYAVAAGRQAIVGEILIGDGKLRRAGVV